MYSCFNSEQFFGPSCTGQKWIANITTVTYFYWVVWAYYRFSSGIDECGSGGTAEGGGIDRTAAATGDGICVDWYWWRVDESGYHETYLGSTGNCG